MWFTKKLNLAASFLKVHGWILWFAVCNMFSPQPTNLKVLADPSYRLNALQSVNHMDHPCTFEKSWGSKYITRVLQNVKRIIRVLLESLRANPKFYYTKTPKEPSMYFTLCLNSSLFGITHHYNH
ncbi:hypothetical protein Hanom_Chr13g01242341 [Helianthus anomalus]